MGWKFHDRDALLDRLTRPAPSRDHVFLFGAALTAPHGPEAPGVPGVVGVINLIREYYRANYGDNALADLERAIQSQPAQAYQAAFEHLLGRGNTEDANRIIRRAGTQHDIRQIFSELTYASPGRRADVKDQLAGVWAVAIWAPRN